MNIRRRTLLAAPAAWAAARGATAQDAFPAKPIRFVIPSTAGSVSDAVARVYADAMAKTLKQPIVIDNMPGGETLLAVRHVAKARPDGYTLGISANTLVTLPYVNPAAGYAPRDFTGIAYLSKMPMALVVGADAPYKTLADLVAAAKAAPGALAFGSVGVGTTSHIPVELFAHAAGIGLRLIPYKGIPLAIPDVSTGRVALMMGTAPSVGELIRAGRLRALAITSEARSASFPGVPTFAELGYEESTYELFLGLVAPAKTPPAVLGLLSAAAEDAKKDPAVRQRLQALGQELPAQSGAEPFNAFLRREEERMRKVVKDAMIRSTPN
ncbi:MAG: tripartite tricarboxylate transporter substrate binding protein [Rubrivivax sp.]